MPISESSGFNWSVKAEDGRILCPAAMVYSPDLKCFLLEPASEDLANGQAMAVTQDNKGVQRYKYIGPNPPTYGPRDEISGDQDEELDGPIATGGAAQARRRAATLTRTENADAFNAATKSMRDNVVTDTSAKREAAILAVEAQSRLYRRADAAASRSDRYASRNAGSMGNTVVGK